MQLYFVAVLLGFFALAHAQGETPENVDEKAVKPYLPVSPIRRYCPWGYYRTYFPCSAVRRCHYPDRCIRGRCCSRAPNCCPEGCSVQRETCLRGKRCPKKGQSCYNGRCCLCKRPTPPCTRGRVYVDLNRRGTTSGYLPGLSVRSQMTGLQSGRACSRQAVFKVNFDKLSKNPKQLCYYGRYCRRTLLRIDLVLSYQKGSHFLDFGDSISNDGWAGDYGDADYAAELHGLGKTATIWANDLKPIPSCRSRKLLSFPNAFETRVTRMSVWISNHMIKVTNNRGLNMRRPYCNRCLFGLNGQPDGRAGGTADQNVWIALNRVIDLRRTPRRTGYGICSATMRWVENFNP